MKRFLQKTARSLDLLRGQVVDLYAAPETPHTRANHPLGWVHA
jgi:hypothetical protein